jgi:hypothetical protein
VDLPRQEPPPRVMLLSLWSDAGTPWHARIVDSEARVHEFDSPFELARYLCVPQPLPPAPGPGLR